MMDLIDDVVSVNNYCCLYGDAFVSCVSCRNLHRSKMFRWAHHVNGCDDRNAMFDCLNHVVTDENFDCIYEKNTIREIMVNEARRLPVLI